MDSTNLGSMIAERSLENLEDDDLMELYQGSIARLKRFFDSATGRKWSLLYEIERPLAVALCQGAAMHYIDKKNGIKDFDIWFFYPFNEKLLPYRTVWTWDYENKKFGTHPNDVGYKGRRVDVLVRSLNVSDPSNPIVSLQEYFAGGKTYTARALAEKAAVLMYPTKYLGKPIWYRQEI